MSDSLIPSFLVGDVSESFRSLIFSQKTRDSLRNAMSELPALIITVLNKQGIQLNRNNSCACVFILTKSYYEVMFLILYVRTDIISDLIQFLYEIIWKGIHAIIGMTPGTQNFTFPLLVCGLHSVLSLVYDWNGVRVHAACNIILFITFITV